MGAAEQSGRQGQATVRQAVTSLLLGLPIRLSDLFAIGLCWAMFPIQSRPRITGTEGTDGRWLQPRRHRGRRLLRGHHAWSRRGGPVVVPMGVRRTPLAADVLYADTRWCPHYCG